MLRISAKVDYAVRALVEVAKGDGRPVKAGEIAETQGIPVRFLGTVLTQLRRSGLVDSRRGGDGGYWLARPGSEICVADVIAAVDGEVIDVRALPDPSSEIHLMWRVTAHRVQSVLATYTIADLASGEMPDADIPHEYRRALEAPLVEGD